MFYQSRQSIRPLQLQTQLQSMPRATLRPLPLSRLASPYSPSQLPTSFSLRLPSQHILPSIRNYFPSISCKSSKPVWPYLYSDKRIMAPQLDTYFKQVDSLSDTFIERLRKAVAIPSVSAEDDRRPEVIKVKFYACISQDMLQ